MIFKEGIGHEGLERELIDKLGIAETLGNLEFTITSGYREGDNGHHSSGRAVDIRVEDAWQRFHIVKALIRAGFNRIGVYDRHIHADVGTPTGVLWTGVSK